jgi:hypothetical protein
LAALHGYALRAPFYISALETQKWAAVPPQPANRSYAALILIPQKTSKGKIRKSIQILLVNNATAGGTVLVLNSNKE